MKNALFSLTLFALLLSTLLSLTARAAVFDSADILGPQSAAISGFGELLLSDPTSEGVEGRARFGLSDEWNVAGIVGTGSKNKKFRLGGEAVFNVLPDFEGQLGFSALGSVIYLNRGTGGLQFRVAPLVHKRFDGFNGLPIVTYAALPFYLEARSGSYTTGSQLALGGVFDLTPTNRYYAVGEGGIKLSRSESYILVGFGLRLGELRFERREKGRGAGKGGKGRADGEVPGDREYRDEDFQ